MERTSKANTIFELHGKKVRMKSLKYKSKEDQLSVMRDWFFENYEDPVESCPYDGGEGGYAFIYGGPYDASEVLQEMFDEHVNFDLIQELADDLQEQCLDWSANSNNIDDWYDEDVYNAIISANDPYHKFHENIEKIRSISSQNDGNPQRAHLLGLLYTNVVTALETFYVELFVSRVAYDDKFLTAFIEKNKTNFKVDKAIAVLPFKGETIDKVKEELIKAIKEHLVAASWHNIEVVLKLYKDTFSIKASNQWPIADIEAATLKRNHLIHRGGKDKEGNVVEITDEELNALMDKALLIVDNLYNSVRESIDELNVLQSLSNPKDYGF
ncbi:MULTISPECIES: hypothetical protein [Aeromonas]|uniref:hypothetical protein n=1 Tax=Aeromonas TaxID=642 RepID=UPI0004746CDB|nr:MULTISPECIES: hypothetical protein [Aeromonas]MBL0603792.1 hypothetical protein [Aeromonas dhakensis]MBW3732483.1 hypothetical protein [Aeromonas dhakensis]MDD9223461.1 hypothetical protein [Aeromonas hydrophila]QSR57047.1 hypothetical protein GO601_17280 [Aeromonas dhakensis]